MNTNFSIQQQANSRIHSIPVSKLVLLLHCPRKFYMDLYFPVKKKKNIYNKKSTNRRKKRNTYSFPKTRAIDLQIKNLRINGRAKVLVNETEQTVPLLSQTRTDKFSSKETETKAAAYCLMLREAGYQCMEYVVASNGNNVKYQINQNMLDSTLKLIESAQKLVSSVTEPEGTPGIYCKYCRFKSSCKNKIKLLEKNKPALTSKDEIALNTQNNVIIPKRICIYTVDELLEAPPVISDALPLYVRSQGSQIGIDSGSFVVTKKEKEISRVLITDVSQISLMGNIQITNQCLRRAIREEIPVALFSSRGTYYGMASGFSDKNAHYRRAQYFSLTGTKPLEICRALVSSKLLNQRMILKKRISSKTEKELYSLAKKAVQSNSVEELRGYEGAGAAMYFAEFPQLLKGKRNEDNLTFSTRNRRPPKDPVNAMLSFGYTLLSKEVVVALELIGLDSMQGFYHTERNRRPALALDLMEPFRPSFVDSVVLGMVKRGQVSNNNFILKKDAVIMQSDFKKNFIISWEKRLQRSWKTKEGQITDCRGMIQLTVKDLVAFLLNRKEKFNLPLFR